MDMQIAKATEEWEKSKKRKGNSSIKILLYTKLARHILRVVRFLVHFLAYMEKNGCIHTTLPYANIGRMYLYTCLPKQAN